MLRESRQFFLLYWPNAMRFFPALIFVFGAMIVVGFFTAPRQWSNWPNSKVKQRLYTHNSG